jgi:predicted transcriptional regulator of viral defense system
MPIPKSLSNDEDSDRPSWLDLLTLANAQQGCFTTDQAVAVGVDNRALYRHVRSGRIVNLRRGIYQVAHYPTPAQDQLDLIIAWLWSEQRGVLSHETALQLHGLSDALPARIHLTLPAEWPRRRLHPEDLALYFAEVPETHRTWIGAVPVTSPARSIVDVARANGDPDIVEAAATQAIVRGIARLRDLAPAIAWLAGDASGVKPEPKPR